MFFINVLKTERAEKEAFFIIFEAFSLKENGITFFER